MDRIAALQEIVNRHDLNNHPFYQDWIAGTLPTAKLQTYAADYGHFIGTIALGWETMGRNDLADEEREHETLWQDFRQSIDAGSEKSNLETHVLVEMAEQHFATPGACVGALYAFEAQQPHTSASKLKGLNEHYSVSESGKEYFVVHADDVREVAILNEAALALTNEEFADAANSCEVICKAMWLALDGVYKN